MANNFFNIWDYDTEEQSVESADSLMGKSAKQQAAEETSTDPYAFMSRYVATLKEAFSSPEDMAKVYQRHTDVISPAPNLQDRVRELEMLAASTAPKPKQEARLATPEVDMDTPVPEPEGMGFAKGLMSSLKPKAKPADAPVSFEGLDEELDNIIEAEGGFQQYTDDSGNYVKGKLIGTNYGITPAALADYKGVDPSTITVEDIKNVTPELAKDIFKENYYQRYKIDRLPENLQGTVFDMVVNSGSNGIKILQRLAGVEADGVLGSESIEAIREAGITKDQYADARIAYYTRLAANKPSQKGFLKGWINRANKYRD